MSTLISVNFETQFHMAQAAQVLLDCHPHHFNVRADRKALDGLSLVALACLEEANRSFGHLLISDYEGNMR